MSWSYVLANIDAHVELGKSAWANFTEWVIQAVIVIGMIAGGLPLIKRMPGVQRMLNLVQRLVVKPVKVAVKESFSEDVIGPIVRTQLDAKLDPFIARMETQFGGNGGGMRQKLDEISIHLAAVEIKVDAQAVRQDNYELKQDERATDATAERVTMQASLDQQHVTTTIMTTPGPVEETP